MSIPSYRQRAARIRNFNKRRLSACEATLKTLISSNPHSFMPYDHQCLSQAYKLISNVLKYWDKDFLSKRTDEYCKQLAKKGY